MNLLTKKFLVFSNCYRYVATLTAFRPRMFFAKTDAGGGCGGCGKAKPLTRVSDGAVSGGAVSGGTVSGGTV
jgi:hypothetical protein